jgi:hypothetical protein
MMEGIDMAGRPPVWQMVREAVEHLGSPTTNAAIREYVTRKYDDVNLNTLNCSITICSVNNNCRVHFPENKKPRLCKSQYDFLFKVGRGEVTQYQPETHGEWEIRHDDFGKLIVAQCNAGEDEAVELPETENDDSGGMLFALESHLRDFLAKNMDAVKLKGSPLKVYVDPYGRDGVEYPTVVGPIDILAVDAVGNFVVIELKVSRGTDRVVGQAMRYIGWVTKHLAAGKKVSGVIVACEIDEKLKYAASVSSAITLFEYKLRFDLAPVGLA